MGASTISAISVGYAEERLKWGAVVKPIWLFTTMCIVPPFLWPLRPDKPKPSAIMPWPANAASPCNRIGRTVVRSESLF